jgi:hypothetical protein
MERGRRAEAPVPCSDVSFRLDQKTANFKAAIGSRPMQWSVLTEKKQKNQLAQTEFRVIKPIIKIRARVITSSSLPPHQRCTAAKDVTCQCLHELCLSESALSAVQPRPLLQLKAMSEVHLTPHVTRQMSHGIIPDSAVRATQEITPHMEQHRDMQDGRRAANTTGLMLLSKAMLTPLAAGGSSFCVHVAVVAAGGTARRSPRLWGTHSRARQATR